MTDRRSPQRSPPALADAPLLIRPRNDNRERVATEPCSPWRRPVGGQARGRLKCGRTLVVQPAVDVSKHRLVAFTGVSGSGKSSLVFDTICTEGAAPVRRDVQHVRTPPAAATHPATGRRHPEHLPLHRDRPEAPRCQQPQHRRHGHRDLHLPADALLALAAGRSSAGPTASRFNHPGGMCPACKGTSASASRSTWTSCSTWTGALEDGELSHPNRFSFGQRALVSAARRSVAPDVSRRLRRPRSSTTASP